jgi:hypothetical protein
VRWGFDAKEAYPLGYAMECRCLSPVVPVQLDVLKAQPLEGRESLLQFASLVTGHERLLAVLQECRKQKKMLPLYDYREEVAPLDQGKMEVKRINHLLQLLKLPLDLPTNP